MGKISPAVVSQWIEETASPSSFRPLRELVTEVLRAHTPWSDEEVAEEAESLELRVAKALEQRVEGYRCDGVIPPFEFSNDDGGAFLRGIERQDGKLLKRLRQLPSDVFEKFCAKILTRLHAESVVEGGPHDGGVDFYAVGLRLSPKVAPAPPSSMGVVLGQCKRFKEGNTVTITDLREFVGCSFRKADELRKMYPDRFGLMTPLLLAYWTTGDFNNPAKEFAKEMGIWYLNGIGVSQLAIRIGLTEADAVDAGAV